jgi:hypothetical protein
MVADWSSGKRKFISYSDEGVALTEASSMARKQSEQFIYAMNNKSNGKFRFTTKEEENDEKGPRRSWARNQMGNVR